MDLLQHALSAGTKPVAPGAAARRHSVVVAGGGGALGSAILESLLRGNRLAHVRVLATQPFNATMAGLETVALRSFDDDWVSTRAEANIADVGLVVFDRERHANGRDAAFLRPEPAQLPAAAAWLQRHGVKHLVVVLPHIAASLPQALRAGLATLDEQAVAALGFEHAVFVRSASPPPSHTSRGLQRVADMVLAQMRLMTPLQQQPVRAVKVAAFVAALVRLLPESPPGTRVVAPEWVWFASQSNDEAATAADWLAGRPLPERTPKLGRM